jgi:O-acetylserine/cysteine efflux transporter
MRQAQGCRWDATNRPRVMFITGLRARSSGILHRLPYPAGSLGALLFLAMIWGGSVPLIKLGLRDFPPLTLTALRYLVAAPFFVLLLRDQPLPPARGLMQAAALGLLGVGVGQVSQTLGVGQTSASVATVISATIPILVVILAAVRLAQPIRPRQAIGLGTAFAGVLIVATGGPRHLGALLATPAARGDGLVALSALAISLYYVLSVELIEQYSVITVAALTSVAGACALAPVSAWELQHAAVRLTAVGIGVVCYLAVLVTVVGIMIWLHALHHLPASVVAVLQYLQPLIGVSASAMLFHDPLGLWFGVGTGLVLLGIGWSTATRV